MAQEIVRLCDPCLTEHGDRAGAVAYLVDLGAGPRSLDLCETHAGELLKPLADALDLWGVKADGAKVRKPKAPKAPAPEAAPAWAGPDHPCPFCDNGYSTPSGLRDHMRQAHDFVGLFTHMRGTCPMCGQVRQGSGPGSLTGHLRADHGLPSLSAALLAARAAGDDHGVDAAVRRALA